MNNFIKLIQLKILPKYKSQYIALDRLYDTMVLTSSQLMPLLSYNMKNKKICKIINIFRRSVSQHILGDLNFESVPECFIQSVNRNSLEIGSIFQRLCGMTSIYLGKMYVHFWNCPF